MQLVKVFDPEGTIVSKHNVVGKKEYEIIGQRTAIFLNGSAMDHGIEIEQQVQRGLQSSLISILSNFLLAMCKCLAGFFGHSFALV
jgi:hypothetical protein